MNEWTDIMKAIRKAVPADSNQYEEGDTPYCALKHFAKYERLVNPTW